MKNYLGEKMRAYRKQHGLTQRQFADLCDLDEFYVSRIENGRRAPGRKALVRIANVMQIPVDALLKTESNAAFSQEYARFLSDFSDQAEHLSAEDKAYILNTLELIRSRFFETAKDKGEF